MLATGQGRGQGQEIEHSRRMSENQPRKSNFLYTIDLPTFLHHFFKGLKLSRSREEATPLCVQSERLFMPSNQGFITG